MIALLLRLYPARWRVRYGDEFVAVLEERPLGPFDVADVVLGALDAHLHLRGFGAASHHAKGFAMSLRIGGYAAILSGLLWLYILAGNAINNGAESGAPLIGIVLVAATVTTLAALVGLSAFQSRRYPVLVWAAFALPAIGAVVGLLGMAAAIAGGDSDATIVGDLTPWMVSTIGLFTLLVGLGALRAGDLASAQPVAWRCVAVGLRRAPGPSRARGRARGPGPARDRVRPARRRDPGVPGRLDGPRRQCAPGRPRSRGVHGRSVRVICAS